MLSTLAFLVVIQLLPPPAPAPAGATACRCGPACSCGCRKGQKCGPLCGNVKTATQEAVRHTAPPPAFPGVAVPADFQPALVAPAPPPPPTFFLPAASGRSC